MDNQTGESAKANQTAMEPQQQAPKGSKALAWAEYGMLGTSAVGTVAAFVTKQAAYAAAPLSVSLFLNLLNRQQLSRRLEYQAQQAGQQTQTLNARLDGELTPVKNELDGLAGRVAQQEQIERDRPDVAKDIASQIQQAQQETTAQLQDLRSNLTGFATSELLGQLQADFAAQAKRTDQVADGLQEAKADLTEQTHKAEQVAEELETVKTDLQSYIQDHSNTHR